MQDLSMSHFHAVFFKENTLQKTSIKWNIVGSPVSHLTASFPKNLEIGKGKCFVRMKL